MKKETTCKRNHCDILCHSTEKKMLIFGPKTKSQGGSPP